MLDAPSRGDATTTPGPSRNPFTDPPEARRASRRLRGRLAAPVTIVTAGEASQRSGLTVSSLLVAEGEPSLAYFLVGATTDLFYVMSDTGRVVVHVCEQRHRELADVFAGLRPSPGGLFAGRAVTQSPYGPVLDDVPTRAFCSIRASTEESYSMIVTATIDDMELADLDDPLVYFRGGYRPLG